MPIQCAVCGFHPVPDGDGAECPHCHRRQYAAACPSCGSTAPTVIRDQMVRCGACSATRGPVASAPVQLGTATAEVAGTAARITGWVALGAGWLAAAVFTTAGFVFRDPTLPAWLPTALFAIGGASGVLGSGASMGLIWGGGKLTKQAREQTRAAHARALETLARQRGGMLSVEEAAVALGVAAAEAEAGLDALRESRADARMEISSSGTLYYVFPGLRAPRAESTGVRVDAAGDTSESATPQETARAQVDAAFEQLTELRRDEDR